MEKNSFNLLIIQRFDEIKDKYQTDMKKLWDGEEIGSTILIEDYLLPYVYANLDNEKIMNKFSLLLEELLSLNDDYCEEVLYCSFFEKIHYDALENKFLPYFKKYAMSFYNKLKF